MNHALMLLTFGQSSRISMAPLLRLAEEAETESSLLSPEQFAHYLVTGLVTIVNLLVAYIILKKFLFKPLMNVMKKRQEAIGNELTSAEEKEKQAEEKLSEANGRLEASHEEAMQIIAEARTQADKQSETIIETARKEAQEIRDRAEEDAKHTKKAMLEEMKDEVADLAVSIAGRVLSTCDANSDESTLRQKVEAEIASTEVKTGE